MFGLDGPFAASIGIAPFFTIIGFQANNPMLMNIGAFFDTTTGWFLVGVVMIAFFSYQLYLGMRTYFKYQRWATYIALFGIALFILVLVLGSMGVFNFPDRLNSIAGAGSYSKMLEDAKAQGVDLTPNFNWMQTLYFIIWPAFTFLFAVLSVSFSGEIKDIKRGQLYAIVGANLISGLIVLLLTYFGRHAVGDQFMIASSALGAVEPLAHPWMSFLASILGGNILLTLFINLSMVILIVYAAAASAVYVSRVLLAWSLDGLAPAKLGVVSDKYHSPIYAILVAAVLALVSCAVYSFTDLMRVLSGIASMGTVFAVVAIAGMLFPFIKRDVYETSPAKIEIGKIPLMTITGFIGAVMTIFVVYRGLTDDTYAANSPLSVAMYFIVIASGAVWYLVAKWIRSRQGVDIDARSKEIPIE